MTLRQISYKFSKFGKHFGELFKDLVTMIIGIDTGVNTGFAILDDGQITLVKT